MATSLDTRVSRFLPTLRLGIDFGETAGGIALVRGREILHAETFVDFHNTTLETRRTLRRGRRSRHAKKMRLARLRSWILRQKLPDGSRLPDPYRIMWNPAYQTKMGLYKQKGQSPRELPTWIEAAKAGHVNADGFVCALTHLFQKRGYKYDDKEIEDLTAARLLDFLRSCARLEADPDLAEKIRGRINTVRERREALEREFELASRRDPQPRKALPRQLRLQELHAMVNAFAKRIVLSEAESERWQHELCGLLNRVVREARFENRIKSGCSWCGKKTPRLSKLEVRESAYLAAVGNLRVQTENGARRALDDDEKEKFRNWWRKRRLPSSEQKFASGRNVPIFDRAPTKENLTKAFDDLRVVKSNLRDDKGKPYFGYPMLRQIDNLLNSKSTSGRANLCSQHLRMAAEGKTMRDAGVEWQQLRRRMAPNPCREQHDARVLKRVERILFLQGKQGTAAWRYGQAVSYITLEIPEPDTMRVQPGQQTAKDTRSFAEKLRDEAGGRCVYCNREIPVSSVEKDHIVPESKGGPDVFVNRVCACKDCNRAKDNRLPSEWLRANSLEWAQFSARVNASESLPKAKKELLLLCAGSEYPKDKTPLARVGARPAAFIAELGRIFRRYGVEPPHLDYSEEKLPLVQRVGGKWTKQLRESWMWSDPQANIANFPKKNRYDLYNHAQDAALLAATPPHTWREQVLSGEAIRPRLKRDAQGAVVCDDKGQPQLEMRHSCRVVRLDLAPDWAAFVNRRRRPLVQVLGKLQASWKRQIMDQSFYQKPADLDVPKLKIHRSLEQPTAGGQRRETQESQKGGLVIQVPYRERVTGRRLVRKVQVKPIQSTAAIFWTNEKGKLQISLERPAAIRQFLVSAVDPPLPAKAMQLGRWERGEMLWLEKSGIHAAGFYKVKEIAETGVIVIPENSVTAEVARRMELDSRQLQVTERKLGKHELLSIFAKVQKKEPPISQRSLHAAAGD